METFTLESELCTASAVPVGSSVLVDACPVCGSVKCVGNDIWTCDAFDDVDESALEHVNMLLEEYAWSDDEMTPEAERLKNAMSWVWRKWIQKAYTGQKLRHPEPAAQNNQNAHSQIRSANEGLPPALC